MSRRTQDPPDGRSEGDAPTPVGLLGFGRVGTSTLELALQRPWLQVVGVFAKRAERDGQRASLTVPSAPGPLRVSTDLGDLARLRPEVVLMATTSRLSQVHEQLGPIAAAGARAVVSTAEELAYIEPADSPAARAISELALEAGMSVLATGVNPGFVLDLWPLTLSALAWDVDRVEARRVVDVSVFASHSRSRLGIGHDPPTFATRVADGSIAGHLGFHESLRLMCTAMGRTVERISVDTEPIIAERDYEIADGIVRAGTTVAASQRAVAWFEGKAWISIELLLHVAPAQDGISTIDEAHVYGRHELHARLEPGAGAIMSTAAQLVNSIPAALRAPPGVYGPGRLPPSPPWLAASRPPIPPAPVVVASMDPGMDSHLAGGAP